MRIIVDTIVECNLWKSHKSINKNYIKKIIQSIFLLYPNFQSLNIEIALLFTSDENITTLNKNHLNKEGATNVLSFPQYEIDYNKINEFKINEESLMLGDIAFAYEIIKKEAELSSKSFEEHFTHLLVHGVLHLLGYDHIHDADAEIMEGLEEVILKKFNIDSPYLTL